MWGLPCPFQLGGGQFHVLNVHTEVLQRRLFAIDGRGSDGPADGTVGYDVKVLMWIGDVDGLVVPCYILSDA